MPYLDLVFEFVTRTPGTAILLAVLAIQFVSRRIARKS